jgi:hypothetical protein
MGCVTPRVRSTIWLAAVPAAVVTLAAAVAEPPEGPPPGPADRLRAALDANGDHELDEQELENATAALRSLDEDGNGRIDRGEFRPPLPPPPREFGGRGGPEGRPPREEGEFRRGREGFRSDGPPGDRPRRERSEGRPEGPSRERPEGPRREGGGPPGRGPGQGPSPERFVERAMSFDGDGDGKLDREEVGTFAAEMMERMRAGMAERMRGGGPPRRGPPDSE